MDVMKSYVDEYVMSRQMQEYVLNTTTMGDCWSSLSEWFWSPYFWLPDGVTWDDFKARQDVIHADPTEIWTYPILIALVFTLIRIYIINPHISSPIGLWMGVKHKNVIVPKPNASLEKLYAKHGSNVPSSMLASLAGELKMTTRQMENWLRKRQLVDKFTTLDKFNECFFSLIYHIIITVVAVVSLYSKPWVSNVLQCFVGYPHHSIDSGLWWLYMVALGFYWSLTGYQLFHPHGKDILTEMIHHTSTIMLISFSWTCGFFRFGSLILLVHEPTDIPLLLGKLSRYANLHKHTDVVFAFFIVLWFYTRVYLFPFWLLRACFFDMPPNTLSRAVYVQYIFITLLFILNFLWTVMIIRIIYKKLVTGNNLEDVRSSDEVSEDENGDVKKDK